MSSYRIRASLPFVSLAGGVLACITVGYLAGCGGDDMMQAGDTCSVGQVVGPGQQCSVGEETFVVEDDGLGLACLIESDGISRLCGTHEVTKGGFSASNIDDTMDWRIDSMP